MCIPGGVNILDRVAVPKTEEKELVGMFEELFRRRQSILLSSYFQFQEMNIFSKYPSNYRVSKSFSKPNHLIDDKIQIS